MMFLHVFNSEWRKKKRSLASWLVVLGAFFTPVIVTIARLVNYESLPQIYASDRFWNLLWSSSWESMAIFLLPLGVILATSLVTQLEYKNNTWKQVHTLPVGFTTIFFAKLMVIVVMMLQFFVLFNIGIYLSGVLPCLLVPDIPYPTQPIPFQYFIKENALFFIDCLPIIALQYLISLQFRNFLVPVGAGFALWVGSLAALSWKFGYVIPYTYGMLHYLKDNPGGKVILPLVNVHVLAVGYFVGITLVGYVLYRTKKDKS
ncbi:ABC transporter permease [Flavobacterium sp.]|uniref:ABC transporter permease n=1 Tax=Flavobacterium sp. TaxID=239 RepID=UPI0025C5C9F5|nr:ABC transporter permease [Flavobacterium sp.]